MERTSRHRWQHWRRHQHHFSINWGRLFGPDNSKEKEFRFDKSKKTDRTVGWLCACVFHNERRECERRMTTTTTTTTERRRRRQRLSWLLERRKKSFQVTLQVHGHSLMPFWGNHSVTPRLRFRLWIQVSGQVRASPQSDKEWETTRKKRKIRRRKKKLVDKFVFNIFGVEQTDVNVNCIAAIQFECVDAGRRRIRSVSS